VIQPNVLFTKDWRGTEKDCKEGRFGKRAVSVTDMPPSLREGVK
jgi:hypothetical protein